jgi:hypothetical protein
MGLGVFFLGTAEHFIWVSMTLMPLVVGSFLLFLGNYIKNGNHLFETILQTIVNSPNQPKSDVRESLLSLGADS